MLSEREESNYLENPRYSFQNSGRNYTDFGDGFQRYSLARKSTFSRNILVKDNSGRIAYTLVRDLGVHINYTFLEGCSEKILFQGTRKAIKSSIMFRTFPQSVEFELKKPKIFSFKYQFNWNAETYQWKRTGFGTLNMECVCPRTGVKYAAYKWKAMAWKNLGTLEIHPSTLKDPMLQSLLLATGLFLVDLSQDS